MGHLCERCCGLRGVFLQNKGGGGDSAVAVHHVVAARVDHGHLIAGQPHAGSNALQRRIVMGTLGTVVGKVHHPDLVVPIDHKPRAVVTRPVAVVIHNPKANIFHVDTGGLEIGFHCVAVGSGIDKHLDIRYHGKFAHKRDGNAQRVGDHDPAHRVELGESGDRRGGGSGGLGLSIQRRQHFFLYGCGSVWEAGMGVIMLCLSKKLACNRPKTEDCKE